MLKALSWRDILGRLPLPMLAFAASYGVYQFALLFVPGWVAIAQAAAFETTYVGLAVARIAEKDRKRASVIAVSAVSVSVLYNTVSGLFHRRPDLLIQPPLLLDIGLSILHGLPLAIVAYNVAALLLHSQEERTADEKPATQPTRRLVLAQEQEQPTIERASVALDRACPGCNRALSAGQYGAAKRYGYCAACKEAS